MRCPSLRLALHTVTVLSREARRCFQHNRPRESIHPPCRPTGTRDRRYRVVSLEKCTGFASNVKTEDAIYGTAQQLKKINPDVKVTRPTSLDLCWWFFVLYRPLVDASLLPPRSCNGDGHRLTHTWLLNPFQSRPHRQLSRSSFTWRRTSKGSRAMEQMLSLWRTLVGKND
jgi:hypothetical protein